MAVSMTFNAAGNIRSSASLAAGANATYDVDSSTKYETQITVLNTPGGTVAGTRGLKIEILQGYGSSVSYTTIATQQLTLPSAAASTAESITLFIGPGKFRIKITNLDASNAITVEITSATLD